MAEILGDHAADMNVKANEKTTTAAAAASSSSSSSSSSQGRSGSTGGSGVNNGNSSSHGVNSGLSNGTGGTASGNGDDDVVLTKEAWCNAMASWLQNNSERRHNLIVVVPSTPAQYFHCLRRQIHRPYSKPGRQYLCVEHFYAILLLESVL